jgi:sigma-E factor negative regulatory protein RseC
MKSPDTKKTIEHKGIVQSTDEKSVNVVITSKSACSGCHAEGSCTLSGKEEKIIEITGRYNVKPGDSVTVLMNQSMGFAALFLGYVLPLISVLTILIILISFHVQELIAGLVSLATLIPYFGFLLLLRKRINQKFTFTLKE